MIKTNGIRIWCHPINNGNWTERRPIRSIIIQVINKICLITGMITGQIGQHKVLLSINHIYNKIQESKRRKRTGEGIDNSFICEIRKKKLIQV